MSEVSSVKNKLALVIGNVPTIEEIDQFKLLTEKFDFKVVTSASIAQFIKDTSLFNDLNVVSLPDHDENPTYIPGLESALTDMDIVVVKERLGLYAFQVLKAKWRCGFKMVVWVDNASAYPGQDINQLRIIRSELSSSADAFIVQSDVVRDALILEGIEKSKIFKFLPFVELKIARNHKNRLRGMEILKLKEQDFVIAHTGQQEWEDGIFDLVDAAKLAMDQNASLARKLKLVFCGVGSGTLELRARLRIYGMEQKALFIAPSRDAIQVVYAVADCIFTGSVATRDRVDTDPYRLLNAMVHKIPVLASRNGIVEEMIGKHRIDFCPNHIPSLCEGIKKAVDAKALVGNIVNKNLSEASKRFNLARVQENMLAVMNSIVEIQTKSPHNTIDRQVIEIESKVFAGQYLEAIDSIQVLFNIKDLPLYHRSNLYRLVGDCFTKLGDGSEGKNAYLKSLELDPYQAKSHIGLGTIALTRASYDTAIMTFQKAVSLSPNDDMANLGLGLAFEGLGELVEGQKWMEQALKVNPENTIALYSIVKMSFATDQFEAAKNALYRYVTKHPYDTNMLFSLAGLEFKSGSAMRAQDICHQLIEIDANDQRPRQLLNEIERAGASTAAASN